MIPLLTFLAAMVVLVTPARAEVTLTHVHGLAYSADGKRLMIASHFGLAIYENGKWRKAPGPEHDYMGFCATAKSLYSSGHPAAGSGLVNPFGLLRSRDGGKTWEKLGLEGESDFHLLAASWRSNAIYVWNAAPNSRMKRTGLHYTLNDGLAWKSASAKGLAGNPYAIAVHPGDARSVAAATPDGVFASSDAGEHFAKIAPGQGTAAFFDLDGKQLWYARHDGRAAHLARTVLGGGGTSSVALPTLIQDAVSFIAQNPARRSEYAIATFNRNVYLSPDSGKTWRQIADQGKGL